MICLEKGHDKDLFVFSSTRNKSTHRHIDTQMHNNNTTLHGIHKHILFIRSQYTIEQRQNCSTFRHKKQSKSTCEYVEENYLNRLDLYVCVIHLRFRSSSVLSYRFSESIDFLVPLCSFFLPCSLTFLFFFCSLTI